MTRASTLIPYLTVLFVIAWDAIRTARRGD
jgi:hypothetical protein